MSVAIKLTRSYKLDSDITRADIGKYVELDIDGTPTNTVPRSVKLATNNSKVMGKLLSVNEIADGLEGSVEVLNSVMVGRAADTVTLGPQHVGYAVVGAGDGNIKPVAAGTANSRGVIDDIDNDTKEIYFVPINYSE